MPVGLALSVHLRRWVSSLVLATTWVSGDPAGAIHAGDEASGVLYGKVLRASMYGFVCATSGHARQLARAANAEADAHDAACGSAGTGANRSRTQRFVILKPSAILTGCFQSTHTLCEAGLTLYRPLLKIKV